MDRSELVELLSPEGLRLLDSLPPYEQTADVVRVVSDLRKAGHAPGLVNAVLSQSRLRAKALTKFIKTPSVAKEKTLGTNMAGTCFS